MTGRRLSELRYKGYITDEEYEEIKKALKKPKTGHWTEKFNDTEGEIRFYCDKCGEWEYFKTDYCPNCGCRMESEE